MKKVSFDSFKYLVEYDGFSKNHRKVSVFYIHNNKNYIKTLLIKKNPNRKDDQYYIDQAEKIIKKMVSSDELSKHVNEEDKKKKKKQRLFILVPLLSVCALAGGGVGAYFALNKEPLPPPPEPYYGDDYFNFTCLSDEANLCKIVTNDTSPIDLEYSLDKANWREAELGVKKELGYYAYNYPLEKDQTIYFRGNNPNGFTVDGIPLLYFVHHEDAPSGIYMPEKNGDLSVGGNILSLIYKDRFKNNTNLPYCCFQNLFSLNANLIDASQLELPSETGERCYLAMFRQCNNLSKAPKLPATSLADSCYASMFMYCSSLTEAPELPATELGNECYLGMFSECTSLERAPILPTVTEKLSTACYSSMFYNCTKLNYLEVKFGNRGSTAWPSTTETNNWLHNAGSDATNKIFIWNGSDSGPTERDSSTVPSGWSINPPLSA